MYDVFLSAPDFSNLNLNTQFLEAYGDSIVSFETKLSKLWDNKSVLAVNSGTSAIHLALILLGVEKGDEVICQSLTYVASANPITYLGAIPVFVDSEYDTWNICPNALEVAIKDRLKKKKKIKAIIVVDLYGMPCKYNELLEISRRYNIPILEDSAEALGSRYKGHSCGNFGQFSIVSFNNNKIVTTLGGGALICNDDIIKANARFLSTQAKDDFIFYQHSSIGYNYLMSPLNAILGISQLDSLKLYVEKRRSLNKEYDLLLKNSDAKIHAEPSDEFYSNHWLTVVQMSSTEKKDKLFSVFYENRIESRFVWKPMHLQPIYKDCKYYGGDVSEQLFNKGLCLPSGNNLTENMKCRVFSILHTFFK